VKDPFYGKKKKEKEKKEDGRMNGQIHPTTVTAGFEEN